MDAQRTASLRGARLACGISVRALARKLGISASYLSKIELGHMTPSAKRLTQIETLLAKETYDALEGKSDRKSDHKTKRR